jgi:hydrogenase maturation protein HypF
MQRRMIEVRGIVQGVGFRPFVYGLAVRHQLTGFVRNQAGRVVIEAEGDSLALDRFLVELADRPPPLAHIKKLSWEPRQLCGDQAFCIEASEVDDSGAVFISPDAATCQDCLSELLDPTNQRHGYPFLNCTNCGPRLTIITGAPYDRSRTTMAGFPMCATCRAEFEDPGDRRFHAQPTACSACGPRLQLLDADGQPTSTRDPLASFAQALLAGKIGAIKGLGGFHLTCDARSHDAVGELRHRKHRDEKPFAVMVPDLATAAALCEVRSAEQDLLLSTQAPIVLLRKRLPHVIADEVAPRNPRLGVALPYSPLHHLLIRAVSGIPLVMTSGNRSDEPIAYREDVVEKLAGIADLFLTHDRPIHVRCDDSVTRVIDEIESPVRRSRGYAPRPVALPFGCPRPILAVGGQLKATFALGCGNQAFLSHHMGDLDHYDAFQAFVRDVELYEQLLGVTPEWIVCDQHPDYATTRSAETRSRRLRQQLIRVQHHHGHMASCMAENGLTEPVIGVSFDGTGYGTDGAVWGGEFLVGSYREFRRAAHLRYVGMPGGEQAIREPWRMAVAHLADANAESALLEARCLKRDLLAVQTVLSRRAYAPLTSSVGRLFDAVASLAGIRDRVSYEGQAAIELEALAEDVPPDTSYPFELSQQVEGESQEPVLIVDTRPLIKAVTQDAMTGVSAARIARRFHSTLVELIARVCGRLHEETGLASVVLSGGVFMNALLTSEVCMRLSRDGFRVYRHRVVPPNDGGLSLGQIAIAAALQSAATLWVGERQCV